MYKARARFTLLVGVLAVGAALGTTFVSANDKDEGQNLTDVRAATAPLANIDVAIAAGYGKVKGCAQNPGVGGMGQHYVKGDLVGDPALNPLRPEALVFEPRGDGSYRLVAVEYIVIKADWEKANGATVPRLYGQSLELVTAPNPYELPDFYELHLWLWKSNPLGLFSDWNPRVSCRGLPF
jgi:hypothetical protein